MTSRTCYWEFQSPILKLILKPCCISCCHVRLHSSCYMLSFLPFSSLPQSPSQLGSSLPRVPLLFSTFAAFIPICSSVATSYPAVLETSKDYSR
ncbi:hypothetical protein TSMEX_011064 [Taenia solium]